MSQEAKTTRDFVDRLRSPDWRKRSVLVFRGTGVNAWHYYPFLKQFSLSELGEFPAIYGVSGGAAIVWFYVLAQRRLFDETVGHEFDLIIRSTMNESGFATRLSRLARLQSPYDAIDIDRFLSSLPDRNARNQVFAECPLPNFSVVAHEKRGDQLKIISATTHPASRVLDVLSQAGTLRELDRHASPEPAGSEVISDFDFAGGDVKRAFQEYLERRHPNQHIYQVNIRRDAIEDRTVFVKVCGDRLPRCAQAMDLLLLFLGLPNPHYRTTFERSYPVASE